MPCNAKLLCQLSSKRFYKWAIVLRADSLQLDLYLEAMQN